MRPSLPQLRVLLGAGEAALLDAARSEATAIGVPLWLVGGAVRDAALGRAVHDLDLAVSVDAYSFALGVAARLSETADVDREERFGTASIRLHGARLDLARLRRERYAAPGALPEVTFSDDIEADLMRRDFTVNAMALGLVGEHENVVVDPLGGLDDLAAGRLRVLHPRSFIDDATRLWRAARTAAVFDLEPDVETARLIAEGGAWLDRVSGERIMAELKFTARRGRSARTLALAEAWGVLRGTHPGLRLDPLTARVLRYRRGAIPLEVFIAVLLAPLEQSGAILGRLAASRGMASTVEQTAQLLQGGRFGADVAPESLERVAGASREARLAARWLAPEEQSRLQRSLSRWERTRSPIDGEELVRLGIPRGPALGIVLDRLRRARYLGTLKTRADAQQEARRMIAAVSDRGW